MATAYELAARGDGDHLLRVMLSSDVATSVRRTAMYGATAAALLDARALEEVLEATAGAAADGTDAAEGDDDGDEDEAATPTGWMAAPLSGEATASTPSPC